MVQRSCFTIKKIYLHIAGQIAMQGSIDLKLQRLYNQAVTLRYKQNWMFVNTLYTQLKAC